MNKKEFRSLVILLIVVVIGVFRCTTAEYDHVDSKYLNYAPDMQGKNLRTEIYVISKEKNVREITDKAFDIMQELIYKFSDEYKESIVYKVNHSNTAKVAMDEDLYKILIQAKKMYEDTNGCFDITVKPVYDLWDFDAVEDPISGDNQKYVPDSLAIKNKLELVDFSKIEFNEDYILMPEGMQITLGSISKGFIVDKIVEYLESQGITGGYVDQISSIRYFGKIKKQIILGVQHPRNSTEIIAELTNLENRSIATSGDYQQFFDVGMKRYHHLINAKTGYPATSNVALTIIAQSAFLADAYSTALFFLDGDEVIEYLKPLAETEAIIYRDHFNTNNNEWEAECIKSGKTDVSQGIDFYLKKENLD